MRQTNQQPLRLDLGQSPQQKLAEATYVFNLSEHRFHDRLAQVVERATLGAFQFVPHVLLHTGTRRQRLCQSTQVRLPLVRRHMQINSAHRLVGQRRHTEVATISRSRLRHSPQILCYLLQHRNQLLLVVSRLHYLGPDDDLRLRIHPNLNVVSLLKTLRYQVLHHPRIRISEVALTLRQRQDFSLCGYLPFRTPIAFCACFWLFLLSTLLRGGGFRFLLQFRFQGSNLSQSRFPITQLFRQLITPFAFAVQLILFFVYALRLSQQTRHFSRQLLLRILHPRVGERLVLRGVGFDLGAINRYVPQLDHQRRMVRRPTATVAFFVHIQYPRKIKRLNHVADVKRQVIRSQPLPQIRRQQQLLI